MATWDSGPFDNDAAAELVAALRDGTFDLESFQAACSSTHIDAVEAEACVALGALSKLPDEKLPTGIEPSQLRRMFTPQCRAWLRRRIDMVMEPARSGAIAMWEETGELEEWLRTAQAAKP